VSPKSSTEGRARSSDLLEHLAREHRGTRIAIGDIVEALGERGFGVLMLVLALPNAVPGPAIPGFSAILAVPLLLLTVQLALGRAEPRLPRWLLRRSISLAGFRRFLARTLPYLRRLEALLRPRPSWLTRRSGLPFLGILLVGLTLVLALPIPFANAPVALAFIVIALAFLERDGRALAVGLAIGIVSCLWVVLLIAAGARLAEMVEALF
jgi:hypothetical protein